MKTTRTLPDDEMDRHTILNYLRKHPGQSCEAAETSRETGVAKIHVRRLMRGVHGIDEAILDGGKVCWNPYADAKDLSRETSA